MPVFFVGGKGLVFVAIVFGAIVSSVILGPCMSISLKKRKEVSVEEFFLRHAILDDLKTEKPQEQVVACSAHPLRQYLVWMAKNTTGRVKRYLFFGKGAEKILTGLGVPSW